MAVVPMDLWRLCATELVRGYRDGAFSPVQALEACLSRIAVCQPRLNAWVMVDEAGARAAASSSEKRWLSGEALGPLDGVPLALKDNLHAAGLPTGWGSVLLSGSIAEHDESPVARVREAGAVIVGKTTLPEFAMQGFTANLVTGVTRNPWNTALTPGGSSGGAAAAVASGCVPLALATDGGGSIRRPASHTGVVGFKPSAGRVPRRGGLPDIFLDYEVAGPLARTVTDARLLTQALAGPGLAQSAARPTRILHVPRFGEHPVDPRIAAQVAQAAAHLRALGHQVDEAKGFDLAEQVHAVWPRLSSAGLAWMMARPPWQDSSQCTPATQASLADGRAMDAASLFESLAAAHALAQNLQPVFAAHDILLTPCTAALPWPADQPFPERIDGQEVGPRGHAVFTAFANAAGLPAIALPTGFVDGLPTGIQLVGAQGSDAPLLALAQQFEQAHPWASAWPGLS